MAIFQINGKDINTVCEVISTSDTRGKSAFFSSPKINAAAFLGSGKTIANAPSGYYWSTPIAAGKLKVNGVVDTISKKGCRPLCTTAAYTKYGSGTIKLYGSSGTIKDNNTGATIFSSGVEKFYVLVTGGGGGSGRGGNNNTGSGGGGGGGGTAIACMKYGGNTFGTVIIGEGGSAGGTGGTGGTSTIKTSNATIATAWGGGGGKYADQSGNAAAGAGGSYSLGEDTTGSKDKGKGIGGCNGTAGANGTAYNAGGRKGSDLSYSFNDCPEGSKGGFSVNRSTAAVGKNGSGGGGGHSVVCAGASGGQGGSKGNAGKEGGAGAGGGGCTGFFSSEQAGAAGAAGCAIFYYN